LGLASRCRIGGSPFVDFARRLAARERREEERMAEYLIYFNQQWVGDHTEEWFLGRAPLARAVVDEMDAAGVLVFARGLEEEVEDGFSVDTTSGTLLVTDGPFTETKEYLGGLTVIDVGR
jgi:hypothetical protein